MCLFFFQRLKWAHFGWRPMGFQVDEIMRAYLPFIYTTFFFVWFLLQSDLWAFRTVCCITDSNGIWANSLESILVRYLYDVYGRIWMSWACEIRNTLYEIYESKWIGNSWFIYAAWITDKAHCKTTVQIVSMKNSVIQTHENRIVWCDDCARGIHLSII